MAEFRIRATGAVMLEDELRRWARDNGGPSWDRTTDEVLEAFGADVVFEGPQATGGTVYQFSMRQGVEQVDGKWFTKHVLGPIFTDRPATDTEPAQTAAQQEAAYKAQKDAEQSQAMREQRSQKLKETDWVVVKHLERNENIPGAWEVYRQALRDVPTQQGFPWNVTWPEEP
jgi:hypothetical protein